MSSVSESSREPETLIDECEALLRSERTFFEPSPGFELHPLMPDPGSETMRLFAAFFEESRPVVRLADQFTIWKDFRELRVQRFKENLEALGRATIERDGLRKRLTRILKGEHEIGRADLNRDIRGLISCAVGCMFGRYNIDMPDLVYRGGDWNASRYISFIPDADGILPVCDEACFSNDIVILFVNWLETVFGTATLEENLAFVAGALGGNGAPREGIRRYFLNDFYQDHLAVFGDHPIYLLFDSGREHAFRCLVYVHRWQPDTIVRIREKYVQAMRRNLDARVEELRKDMNASAELEAKAREIQAYIGKLRGCEDRSIGVGSDGDAAAVYERFADVLAPIK